MRRGLGVFLLTAALSAGAGEGDAMAFGLQVFTLSPRHADEALRLAAADENAPQAGAGFSVIDAAGALLPFLTRVAKPLAERPIPLALRDGQHARLRYAVPEKNDGPRDDDAELGVDLWPQRRDDGGAEIIFRAELMWEMGPKDRGLADYSSHARLRPGETYVVYGHRLDGDDEKRGVCLLLTYRDPAPMDSDVPKGWERNVGDGTPPPELGFRFSGDMPAIPPAGFLEEPEVF